MKRSDTKPFVQFSFRFPSLASFAIAFFFCVKDIAVVFIPSLWFFLHSQNYYLPSDVSIAPSLGVTLCSLSVADFSLFLLPSLFSDVIVSFFSTRRPSLFRLVERDTTLRNPSARNSRFTPVKSFQPTPVISSADSDVHMCVRNLHERSLKLRGEN